MSGHRLPNWKVYATYNHNVNGYYNIRQQSRFVSVCEQQSLQLQTEEVKEIRELELIQCGEVILLRERPLFMTGVGTEDKMVGVTEKSCVRWGSRMIF